MRIVVHRWTEDGEVLLQFVLEGNPSRIKEVVRPFFAGAVVAGVEGSPRTQRAIVHMVDPMEAQVLLVGAIAAGSPYLREVWDRPEGLLYRVVTV